MPFWHRNIFRLAPLFLQRPGAGLPDVVQFCLPDFRRADQFELGNQRGMQRENALDADALGNLADAKGGVLTLAVAVSNNKAFKNLDTFLVAFLNFLVDPDGLAGFYIGSL